MGKAPEAPWGYQCPYRAACPHLQGLPVEWLWLRHQEDSQQAHQFRQRIDELVRTCNEQAGRIHQLEKENSLLKAQWRARHQEQFKSSQSDDTQTDASAETSKEKKKRARPRVIHRGLAARPIISIERCGWTLPKNVRTVTTSLCNPARNVPNICKKTSCSARAPR